MHITAFHVHFAVHATLFLILHARMYCPNCTRVNLSFKMHSNDILVKDHHNASPLLLSDMFLHEPQTHHHTRGRWRRKNVAFKADPECRVMSLTTFPLPALYGPSGHQNLLTGKHYLAVGCSDGIIRSGDCVYLTVHACIVAAAGRIGCGLHLNFALSDALYCLPQG